MIRDAIRVVLLGGLLFVCGKAVPENRSPRPEKQFAPVALGMDVPVITFADERDEYVGRVVAVRGVVSDTKLAFIVGVEVDASDELRGREAYAVGILQRFTVTEDAIRESEKKFGKFAHSGPGVSYTLYFNLSGTLAEARPLPK